MPYTDTFGEAYLFYDRYVKETEKANKKPVGFFGFLIGKR